MRISDWSSDVCSSDLQGAWRGIRRLAADPRHDRIVRDCARGRGGVPHRHGGGLSGAPVADRFGGRGRARRGRGDGGGDPDAARRRAARRDRAANDPGRLAALSDRVRDARRLAGLFLYAETAGMIWRRKKTTERRSEEHTSELQSLMRISYAVFCLKTKKNTPRLDK